MDYEAVLLGAGQGVRMNAPINKVLLEIGSKVLLQYSVEYFLSDERCQGLTIVLASKKEEEFFYEKIVPNLPQTIRCFYEKKSVTVCIGGKERQDSAAIGIENSCGKTKQILLHDGARPFINKELVDRVLEKLADFPAVVPGVPATDTIKKVIDGKIIKTIPRQTLWQTQTPQAFHRDTLVEAYKKAQEDNYYGTDDSSLVERYLPHIDCQMIMGDYDNIKMTVAQDLAKAKAILQARGMV